MDVNARISKLFLLDSNVSLVSVLAKARVRTYMTTTYLSCEGIKASTNMLKIIKYVELGSSLIPT